MSCPCGGRHLALARPVAAQAVAQELADLWWVARHQLGAQGLGPRLEIVERLSLAHRRSARRYADSTATRVVSIAPEFLWLPRRHRRGVLAHEIGHLLLGCTGTEADADRVAGEVLGVAIGYDRAWPGKGLQVVR